MSKLMLLIPEGSSLTKEVLSIRNDLNTYRIHSTYFVKFDKLTLRISAELTSNRSFRIRLL
jgi:hypothetical protein